MENRTPYIVLIVLLIAVLAYFLFARQDTGTDVITPTPGTQNGVVNDTNGNNNNDNNQLPPAAESELIIVDNPRPNTVITSPIRLSGEARGTWYFEADFPVSLLDANGNLVATAIAQAQDEWMTEDFVPFIANLTFVAPATDTGVLVFHKDNPSGLPENDDELRVPVRFR
jgi:hypothetical protein